MAASSYPRAFAATLVYEGGYSDHPDDPGGPTNLGITQATLSRWLGHPATVAEVKALTRETVAPIYRVNYWNAVQGDALPAGLDHAVWDYAVNSGPGRAAKHLQELLGVERDGHIGPATLAAISRHGNPDALASALCDRRMAFLRSLPTWPSFGSGWSKRVAQVRVLCHDLAKQTPASRPAVITSPTSAVTTPTSIPPRPDDPGPRAAPQQPQPGFWSRFWSALSRRPQ